MQLVRACGCIVLDFRRASSLGKRRQSNGKYSDFHRIAYKPLYKFKVHFSPLSLAVQPWAVVWWCFRLRVVSCQETTLSKNSTIQHFQFQLEHNHHKQSAFRIRYNHCFSAFFAKRIAFPNRHYSGQERDIFIF